MRDLIRSFNGVLASLAYRREEILRRCVPQSVKFSCG